MANPLNMLKALKDDFLGTEPQDKPVKFKPMTYEEYEWKYRNLINYLCNEKWKFKDNKGEIVIKKPILIEDVDN